MTKLQNPVLMAVVGAAHGIKGEVRVKTFTEDPLALGRYGALVDAKGRTFEVTGIRQQGNAVVASFKGVGDRNAAEALNGTELFVDRGALPDDLGEEEFYHADLVGMNVVDERERAIGKVGAVQNYGAGDMLEIRGLGLNGVLIPFTRAAVPAIDLAGKTIRIDRRAAGLAGDDESDGAGNHVSARGGIDPARRRRGPREAGGNR
jgi:16S rRNA processing protein RimM